MLKTEDIHPPKTGISVHFSCFLVCQVHPYQRLNVITFNVSKRMPLYLGGSSILNLRSLSRISRISANKCSKC